MSHPDVDDVRSSLTAKIVGLEAELAEVRAEVIQFATELAEERTLHQQSLSVVAAAKAWTAAVMAADDDDDWCDEPYLSLGAALFAAVDQLGQVATVEDPR